MIAPPIVEEHEGILVVRDDLVPGGTKRRVLPAILHSYEEFVYGSPAYGYAQVALAHTCREMGLRATIFTAKRDKLHARTVEAKEAGAKIVLVPTGYLTNVQSKARQYAAHVGACLLPFGLDTPEFADHLSLIARDLPIEPREVWTVAGSGTLSRALQKAWPQARFFAVRVGAQPDVGSATIFKAPEEFQNDAKLPPPFPSCTNYDAKAWQFIKRHAAPGALFWNVAA